MNIPKVVVFDLGKVLLDFDYTIAARKLLKEGKLNITDLATMFTNPAEILYRYESGLVATEEFYTQVCELTGYKGTHNEFAACFGEIFTPIQPLIDAQAEIRKRGIPTYIFSNTNERRYR